MTHADMALVYFFDFTRFKPSRFNGWDDEPRVNHDSPDLFYDGGNGENASFVNGRMIVRSELTHLPVQDCLISKLAQPRHLQCLL